MYEGAAFALAPLSGTSLVICLLLLFVESIFYLGLWYILVCAFYPI